jgi:hypothetical protein
MAYNNKILPMLYANIKYYNFENIFIITYSDVNECFLYFLNKKYFYRQYLMTKAIIPKIIIVGFIQIKNPVNIKIFKVYK